MLLERSLPEGFLDLLSRRILRDLQQFIELCFIDFSLLLLLLPLRLVFPILVVLFPSVKHPTTLNYISSI